MFKSDAMDRFESGLRALANGDYLAAHTDLAWVAQHYGNEDTGQRALLILAAMEMDPRNPARRPAVAADLAASFLRLPERELWVDPIAQTLYLQALELGAADSLKADSAAAERQLLPKFSGVTLTARIKSAEQERDRLAKRVAALEDELAEKQRELERIRKTIKP
jgi:hypothetical protein